MRTLASLRVQILLSLGTLLVLAFLPLFFAVANIARATARGAADDEAALRARSITEHLAEARENGHLESSLLREKTFGDVLAIAVIDKGTNAIVTATANLPEDWPERAPPSASATTTTTATATTTSANTSTFTAESGKTRVRVRFRMGDAESEAAPLLRLIALYIFLFGAVLLAFAYFALTRLIVRPIDLLSREAERVAQGTRKFRPPERGPREIAELGRSVRVMTETLVASEAKLEKRLQELTETTGRLTSAREQLVASERLAGVGKLAAGVAHEIGNPISAILGMLDLISDDTLPADERSDLLRRTQKETERISNIVKDLLDFARPEKSDDSMPTSLRLATSTVDAAVKDVLSLVSAQKDFKRIKVKTDILPALAVTLPQPRLEQVLLNLMLNAGHALEKVQNASIAITGKKEGDRAVIVVEDNGPGVPAFVRGQIFDPFFTTKDVGEGTGLGLSVCRGLVEAVGGEIALDTDYKDGARFKVILPLAG